MRLDFIGAPLPARSVLRLCCNACAQYCNGVGGRVEASDRGVAPGVMNDHPVAIEAAAKELVCRSPEIQTKATIVEFAEPLGDKFVIGVEVARPLLEGEEIAVAVV